MRDIKDLQENGELCNYCHVCDFGDKKVNTEPDNVCHGLSCDEAYENYLESGDDA